jgi:hypothetical protein
MVGYPFVGFWFEVLIFNLQGKMTNFSYLFVFYLSILYFLVGLQIKESFVALRKSS